ncbi:retrotransposon protein, putative, ty3-gypsy subclass [Tanacetum coccineum]
MAETDDSDRKLELFGDLRRCRLLLDLRHYMSMGKLRVDKLPPITKASNIFLTQKVVKYEGKMAVGWLELLMDYDAIFSYHPGQIIKDLELMEVKLVVRGSEGYIACLKIEPNLRLRLKKLEEDGELSIIVFPCVDSSLRESSVDCGTQFLLSTISILVFTKMYRDLSRISGWNGMNTMLLGLWRSVYVSTCLRLKHPSSAFLIFRECDCAGGFLQPLDILTWKWDQISMDFVTGLPRPFKKNDAIWVVVDRLTKSAHFLPIQQGLLS